MLKAELRKLYLHKRLSLNEEDHFNFTAQICNQLFSTIDLSLIKVIHTYLPIEKNREPNTWLIIDRIGQQFPDVQLSIPRVINNSLENFYFESRDQLKKNSWGIPEPMYGLPTPTEDIDLVIVPLLAFDESGHRVGYGKGFYDRFLKSCRPDCKKVGVSFFDAVTSIEDIDPNDIKLDVCVTPARAFFF